MSAARVLAWILFLVWAVWAFAIEGHLANGGSRWVPDIGLVLALSVMARANVGDTPILALFAALARASFGPEPPIVVLAGFMGIVFFALAARTTVELAGPLWRTIAALVFVFAFNVWLTFARSMRDPSAELAHTSTIFAALPVAITSAILAFACGPLFAHLPGLTPIRRRKW
ncbi:MAG: hypothetical protein SGI72_04370 [Planctomycetota bacterium]|nr:hypothetical protein [Planctomycetota bacterium]